MMPTPPMDWIDDGQPVSVTDRSISTASIHCAQAMDPPQFTDASRAFAANHNPRAPHRPARIKTTKINWEALRGMYVRGVPTQNEQHPQVGEWPSLAVVARRSGASLHRVEAISAKENWPEQRELSITSKASSIQPSLPAIRAYHWLRLISLHQGTGEGGTTAAVLMLEPRLAHRPWLTVAVTGSELEGPSGIGSISGSFGSGGAIGSGSLLGCLFMTRFLPETMDKAPFGP